MDNTENTSSLLDFLKGNFDQMPEQASTWAGQVDTVNNVITLISLVCTLLIVGAMLFFAIRYRRRTDNDVTSQVTHNTTMELVWTIIPTIICGFIFYVGFTTYRQMRTPPLNPLEVNVDAYKWRWEFRHDNGKKDTNLLVVPLGQAVRLIMTSHDVIHSFYIPNMRIKEDVVPDRYTYTWFTPTKVGDFHIFCTEYCGTGHSDMLATVQVVTPEQYKSYVWDRTGQSDADLSPAELGAKLFVKKTCNTCHSIDGSALVGPSLLGAYGRTRECTDGTTLVADENYLRESILNSSAKIVKGFAPAMPAFQGMLEESEVQALIAYIKTLKVDGDVQSSAPESSSATTNTKDVEK